MFSLYHNAKRLKEDVNNRGVLKMERRPGAYLYPTYDKQWIAAHPERGDLVHVVLDAADPLASLMRMGVPASVTERIMKRVAVIDDTALSSADVQVFANAVWVHNLPKPAKTREIYRCLESSDLPKDQSDRLKRLYIACGDPLITVPEGFTVCVSTTLILDGKGYGNAPQLYSTRGFKFTKRSIVVAEDLEHATCTIQRHCNNHGIRNVSDLGYAHKTNVDIYY